MQAKARHNHGIGGAELAHLAENELRQSSKPRRRIWRKRR